MNGMIVGQDGASFDEMVFPGGIHNSDGVLKVMMVNIRPNGHFYKGCGWRR
jgi:hypothetical protein